MQTVSDRFRTKAYSGEALYHTILQIEEQEVPIEQISSIEIDSPIVDNTSESFYLGTFISQSLKIKFKNLDGLHIASNKEVYLQIGEERESYNLFNKDSANIINCYCNNNGIVSNNDARGVYIQCSPNTTYTIQKNGSARFRVATTNELPASGVEKINLINNDSAESITITTSNNANYLFIYFYLTSDVNEKTEEEVLDTIMINEGAEALPYEQYGTVTEYIPIGRYLIDDLAEDYFETCEITCLDYAVKLKPNIDYSPCFTRQSEEDTPTATVQTIFNYICNYFGIEVETDISTMPNIDVVVGTYDGSISGKQWISYLAEIMGCNAKFNRDGKLILIPLKHEKAVTINALESEEFTLGEKYEISRVVYFDAVRNFTYGEDIHNTLYIRQDNPFITDGNVVENIYNTLFDYSPKSSNKSELISIDDGNDDNPAKITMYGNTYQETTTGKNLLPDNFKNNRTNNGIIFTYNDDGTYTINGQNNGNNNSALYLINSTQSQSSITLSAGTYYTVPITSADVSLTLKSDGGTYYNFQLNRPSFTLNSETIITDAYLQIKKTNTTVYENFVMYPIIATSEITASGFEPYTNGESPNPDYPQPIETITGEVTLDINGNEKKINLGKNLFDKNTANIINNVYIGGSSNKITASGSGLKLLYIPIDGGKTYTVSKIAGKQFRVSTTEELPALNVATAPTIENNTASIITYTTNESAKYLVVNYYGNNDTLTEQEILDTIQIEEGTEATEYAPFMINKNLVPALSSASGNGLVFKELLDGSTNITGTSTSSLTKYIIQNLNLKAGTYTLSVQLTNIPPSNSSQIILAYQDGANIVTINLWGTLIRTFTLNEDAVVKLRFYSNAGVTFNTNIKVQLEKGATATKFEKYGAPIELCKIGNYQDYIRKSTGKNLYDKSQFNWTDTLQYISIYVGEGTYTMSSLNMPTGTNSTFNIFFLANEVTSGASSATNGVDWTTRRTVTSTDGYVTIAGRSTTANNTYNPSNYDFQIEKNDHYTEYEPYGTVWYKHKEIEKVIFDGSENWGIGNLPSGKKRFSHGIADALSTTPVTVAGPLLSNYFLKKSANETYLSKVGISYYNQGSHGVSIYDEIHTTVEDFKSWLSNHNTTVYYILETPTAEIITNETLISQLESALRPTLLNGDNTITTTNDLKPYLQMDYISKNYFKIWSLQTKNYGDISLDAWDIIEYTLGEDEYHNPITYQTYNNNHINYEMNIASEVNTQIPTKQREITTNIYDNDEEVRVKMIKTLLDYVNAEVILQAEEQREQSRRLTQLRLDLESIQNIFQITGGSNLITNSQFLFDDPEDNVTHERTYWNFTDNGSNPYQNIGSGFDGSLAGQTTSVAKIQLRDIIAETSSANIIGLKEGQTYTLNYSYKQDDLTTTNFQLFDSNGNIVSYSVFNEETQTYETKGIDFTYNSEEINYKNETIQFVTPTSSLILKITTNTLSGDTNSGYFYLYDLMLNSGDKKTWEPAKSEVYSTVLKMSQLGLQVMATGSNIATLINADGFRIFKLNGNNLGEEITTFNDKGLITGIAETDEVHTGNYVMTEIQINNTEHHVEYFKERN